MTKNPQRRAATMPHSALTFNNGNRVFITTLRQRVDLYFAANNLSKKGGSPMLVKAVVLLVLYVSCYLLIISGWVTHPYALLALAVLMGLLTALIGLAVMHDANHGSFSDNPTLTRWASYSLYLLGGFPLNWQIQHNQIHHVYTNVNDVDEDIMPPTPLLRFSPHDMLRPIHRFQYLYAWLLYSLMTITWTLVKDFRQLGRYHSEGYYAKRGFSYNKVLGMILATKIVYFTMVWVVPMFLLPIAWWQVLLGWLVMQMVTGIVLAAIFQPAHVVPTVDYPLPDPASGQLENDWATNQILTTSNFAQQDHVFSWLVGGLNHQIEHHLFPDICHVHFPKISHIVKATANEFGLPYHSQPTFLDALKAHTVMLYRLGRLQGT